MNENDKVKFDKMRPYAEQINEINKSIAITFSPSAWDAICEQNPESVNIEYARIHGKPCYIVEHQKTDAICWYLQEALDAYLEESAKLKKELNETINDDAAEITEIIH